MAKKKPRQSPSGSKPCPSTGPARDGRGKGKGVPGGSRRGRSSTRTPRGSRRR